MELTGETLLLSVLKLLAALEKGGDNIGEELRKVVLKHARHHAEEQEAALAETRAAQDDTSGSVLHHIRKVRAEHLLAHGLGERANGVHGDATELLLLAFSGEGQELLEVVHGRLEVWQELLPGRVRSAADGADDDLLEGDRGGREKTGETLHDGLEVLVDHTTENLEESIESCACGPLGSGVVDELEEGLRAGTHFSKRRVAS